MRERLVAGNWKLHGSLAANEALLRDLLSRLEPVSGVRYAVCVPFPYLAQCQSLLDGSCVDWGAQDVSEHPKGAFTGEVAASMVAEFGSRYALVGHSERRTLHGEDDRLVAAKARAVLDAGMVPVACVGETLAEREAGATEAVVARQFDAVAEVLGAAGLARSVLAYEPVWAIGTGRTATPDQAQAVHAFLRGRAARIDGAMAQGLAVLYGGSVKAGNAKELFSMPDIDGGLIGGASLSADEFSTICRAAAGRA